MLNCNYIVLTKSVKVRPIKRDAEIPPGNFYDSDIYTSFVDSRVGKRDGGVFRLFTPPRVIFL